MTPEEFKAELKKHVILSLEEFALEVEGEEMRAFDLGIFPWHQDIIFSFLTTEDFNDLGCHPYAENWEHFNFSDDNYSHLFKVNEKLFRTDYEKEMWYFGLGAEVLHDSEVKLAFGQYKLSPDFEFYVFHPDEREGANYYLEIKK